VNKCHDEHQMMLLETHGEIESMTFCKVKQQQELYNFVDLFDELYCIY